MRKLHAMKNFWLVIHVSSALSLIAYYKIDSTYGFVDDANIIKRNSTVACNINNIEHIETSNSDILRSYQQKHH